MTTPTEPKKELDLDALVNSINTKVDATLAGITSKMDTKINSMATKPVEKVKEETFDDLFGDEDDSVSREDLKKVIPAMVNKAAEIAAKNTQKIMTENTVKNNRDFEAIRDFPMLNKTHDSYSPEFEAEVGKEIARRKQSGRSENDPDLVYDAAAVVKAINPKWHKEETKKIQEENRRFNNNQNNFSVKGGGTQTDNSKPTEDQYALGMSFGMSKDALDKQFKRQAKNK